MKLIYALLAISPLISLFSGQMLVPILIVILLALTFLYVRNTATPLNNLKPIHLDFSTISLIIITVLYLYFSAIGSLDSIKTLRTATKIIVLTAMGVYGIKIMQTLQHKYETTSLILLPMCFLGAVILALFEYYSEGFFTHIVNFYDENFTYHDSIYNRAAVYLSFLVWPILYFFIQKRYFIFAFLTITIALVTVSQLSSLTALLGLVVSTLLFISAVIFKKLFLKIITISAVISILLVPIIATQISPISLSNGVMKDSESSVKHRLFIWHYVAKKALEKPIAGWGLDSSRSFPISKSDYIPDCWGAINPLPYCKWEEGKRPHPLPLHPHNATLQIWLELGSIGVLLYAAIVGFVGFNIANAKCSITLRNFYFTLFAQLITVQQTGFGAWQSWLWAAFMLALIQLVLAGKTSKAISD